MTSLLYPYDDPDITSQYDDPTDIPSAAWDTPLPADKLWVNPHADTPAVAFTTEYDDWEDAVEDRNVTGVVITCPTTGCDDGIAATSRLTYNDMRMAPVAQCQSCETPLLAHQAPPAGWDTPAGGRP